MLAFFDPDLRSGHHPGLGLPALRPGLAARRYREPAARRSRPAAGRRRGAAQGRAHHRQRCPPTGAATHDAGRRDPAARSRRLARYRDPARLSGAQRLRPHRHGDGGRRLRRARRHRGYLPPQRRAPGAARFLWRRHRVHALVRPADAAARRACGLPRPCAGQRGAADAAVDRALPHRLPTRVRRRDRGRPALRVGLRRAPLSRYRALAAAVPRWTGDALRLRAGGPGPARPSRGGSARRPLRDDCGFLRRARQPADLDGRGGALSPGRARGALSRRGRMGAAACGPPGRALLALRGDGRRSRRRRPRRAGLRCRAHAARRVAVRERERSHRPAAGERPADPDRERWRRQPGPHGPSAARARRARDRAGRRLAGGLCTAAGHRSSRGAAAGDGDSSRRGSP